MYRGAEEEPEKDLKEAMYKISEDVGHERSVEIDKTKLRVLIRENKENQNLALGIVGGIAGAIIGAVGWGLVSALTGYQIGFMAVGVGFLTGIAVRKFGRGVDKVFGLAGALLSLAGCLAGNILTVCIVISRQEGVPLLALISHLNPEVCTQMLGFTFSPIDLLFYGIAVYEGYKFSFRRFSPEDLSSLARG